MRKLLLAILVPLVGFWSCVIGIAMGRLEGPRNDVSRVPQSLFWDWFLIQVMGIALMIIITTLRKRHQKPES